MKSLDVVKIVSLPIGLFFVLTLTTLPAPAQDIPAFPGAEGFGCETPGGRGGKVVLVTNLNDSGPGSLREALLMTEPRIIVFKVSGTIYLQSDINLGAAHSYVTVAGQTAPGDGICIANYRLRLSVNHDGTRNEPPGIFHDAVFRNLRFRAGDIERAVRNTHSITVFSGSHHLVFDHNSFTWVNDQAINHWGSNIHDITWSWNIVAEGLGQKNASLFSGDHPHDRITVHHNYLAHQAYRNYMVATGRYDFINNVNYNTSAWDYQFDQNQYTGPDPIAPDLINQYIKEGPDTNRHIPFLTQRNRPGTYKPISIYLEGNKAVDINENLIYDLNDQWSMVRARKIRGILPSYEQRHQPHTIQPQFPVTTQSTDVGKDSVLANAGARLPKLDAVDSRLIRDFWEGRGYNANNIGKYPNLQTYNVPKDTDHDGMPDEWELARGLNPNDGTDHNQDRDGDGYTNIEEWINSIGGVDSNALRAIPAASPISGQVPLFVSFTGSAAGGTSPYRVSWDFGDGGNSTEQNPTYTFESAGTYGVILTVIDNDNNSATKSMTILANHSPEPSQNSITALKTRTSLTMDGNLSEDAWSHAEYVNFSNPTRSDNEVKAYTLWDDHSLYFAYEVTDGNLEAINQNYTQDDGAEIYIDAENDKTASLNANDHHYVININDLTQHSGIAVKTTLKTNGYIIEISIPWSLMNTTPSPNKTMGLLLANNDRDNGIGAQFDWLNLIESGSYARPNLWGDIVLSDKQADSADSEAPLPPKNVRVTIENGL